MTDGSDGALAPEWRRWVVENLLGGAEEAELVSVLEGAGVDAAVAREAVRSEMQDPCFEGTRKALALNRKLEGLLNLYGDLYRQADGHERVDRRESLSREEFFDRYYFQNRPVVMRGTEVDAESLGAWRPMPSAEAEGFETEARPVRENMLLCQVHGRRRLQLIPAFELRRMTGEPEEQAAATRLEIELGPGELALVPVGWWLAYRVLEASTSVVLFAASEPKATWEQEPSPPEPTPPPWRKRG
ncbi:hypothetical protein JY651_20735 [Pyxidicoccus parkwayensis]|uniref:Cupin-like domain-containing protein n=1 Tax=Pyxidicoccus parkwayensis TaxID=2813578 RepID=A0ABX7P9J0_9BACT|nr:hypothetical protein [Pyxidicoccus parkwaysis]QSQ27189.1 hypothetical protein JY651_20735 [Pyxidicoccus parkwaysis]